MQPTLWAAFAYAGIVFAAGFVLGTLRTFLLAPYLGSLLAVAIELPVILAVSWSTCRRVVNRCSVPSYPSHRLVMGGLAFCLLMLGEYGVSRYGFGRSLIEHLKTYQTASGILGLVAQVAFALFPLLQSSTRRHPAALPPTGRRA